MAVIYVKEQGALVHKKGGCIAVSRNAQADDRNPWFWY